MFNEIIQQLEPNFFQNRSEIIKNTITSYAEAINNNSLSQEDREIIKNDSETILRNILIESGYKSEQDAFISIDREFFRENDLDLKKVESFQKKMLMHYSAEQLKWTFAGTTSLYSPATIKTIEKTGLSHNAMLPASFHKKTSNPDNSNDDTISADNKNNFDIYLFPDGTTSNVPGQGKKRFSFNELKDKTGFNWSTGYSPSNNIKKDSWMAGFNQDDVWEKVSVNNQDLPDDLDQNDTQNIIYTETSYSGNTIHIVSHPDNDYIYVYDVDLKLMEEHQEEFYSLTGELYGVREIDRERSINELKTYLQKNKIQKISGFVLGSTSDDAKAYYTRHFEDFISSETRFVMPEDPELNEAIDEINMLQEESEISKSFISSFVALAAKGRRGAELYDGMLPSTEKSEYRVNLNIFDSPDDLKTFISIPDIKSILSQDSEQMLAGIDVPDAHKAEFSNSIQNILRDYKKYFSHSKIDSSDLIKTAYNVVVKKDQQEIHNAKNNLVTSEKNLYELIVASKTEEIHKFVPYNLPTKNSDTYHDIFSRDDFFTWAAGKQLSAPEIKQQYESLLGVVKSSKLTAAKKTDLTNKLNNHFNQPAKTNALSVPVHSIKNVMTAVESIPDISSGKDVIIRTVKSIIEDNKRVDQIVDEMSGDIIQVKSFDENMLVNNLQEQGISEADIQNALAVIKPHATKLIAIQQNSAITNNAKSPQTWEEIASYTYQAMDEAGLTASEKNALNKSINKLHPADPEVPAPIGALISRGISMDMINTIWNKIENSRIPDNKKTDYSVAIQNMFTLFEDVRMSTGLNPPEIMTAVENIIVANVNKEKYQKMRVFFNRSLMDIIDDSARAAAEPVIRFKEDLFLTRKADALIQEVNLLNETDIKTFALSPLLLNSSINGEDRDEIITYLKNVTIPVNQAKDFTRGVINTIKSYKNTINPKGFKAIEAIQFVEQAVKGTYDAIPVEIKQNILSALGSSLLSDSAASTQETFHHLAKMDNGAFDFSNKKDIDYFISSPLLPASGINNEEAAAIGEILKNASIPKTHSARLSKSLSRIIKKYKNSIAPLGYTPHETVNFVVQSLNGQKESIPAQILAIIDGSVEQTVFEEKPANNMDADMIHVSSLYNPEIFKNFLETEPFKNSGLNASQLTELLLEHKKAFKRIQSVNKSQFPVQYASQNSLSSQTYTFNIPQHGYMHNESATNSMDNIAWSVSNSQPGNNALIFTALGLSKLNPVTKNMILQQIKKTDKSSSSAKLNGIIKKTPTVSYEQKKNIIQNNNFVYSGSMPSIKGANALQTPEFHGQSSYSPNNSIQHDSFMSGATNRTMNSSMVPENIQQNYIKDTRALAKSSSISDNKTATPIDGKKIKKVVDELLNDFTHRMDDEF